MAYDYLRYRKIKSDESLKPELSVSEREVLLARSQLKVASAAPQTTIPEVRPDQGHGTARIGMALGQRSHAAFIQMDWRAAYHDLLDPGGGYSENAKVDFFNLVLRYYNDRKRVELHRFTLLDIVSLEPRDDFFRHISWHMGVTWDARQMAQKRICNRADN